MVRLSLLLSLSFLIAAFGAPYFSGALSVFAAAFGYALFWSALLSIKKRRFWLALGWFAAVQAVQLSWLTSIEYMGPFILVVYGLLITGLGVQFACLSMLIRLPLGWVQMLSLAGFWVLMEWSRLFLLTGFPWNPLGLALAANPFSIQFAALFGVYGLCFWVIWVNLLALRASLTKQMRCWVTWALFACLPYGYGALHRSLFASSQSKELSVALVQTALRPEERQSFPSKLGSYVHPLEQWDRILSYLAETSQAHFDLIVLPEAALPHGVKQCEYPIRAVRAIWEKHFGPGSTADFPAYRFPFAKLQKTWSVSNAFWLQSLSNRFASEVIIGLDDSEADDTYNAAVHFAPNRNTIARYEKRILIPVGEYVPFSAWTWFAAWIAKQFGMEHSFSTGQECKIFQGSVPIGIFICLEELYSQFVRDIRRAGAELFVNVTNDAWFPETRLPRHHFEHGRLRAVENGICLLRSCNTGVTAVIDCFGDCVAMLPVSDRFAGALHAKFTIRSFATPYTFWGDAPILICSAVFFGFLVIERTRAKKRLP